MFVMKQIVQAVVKVLLIRVCTNLLQQKWTSEMLIILFFEVSDSLLAFCGSYMVCQIPVFSLQSFLINM